MSQKVGENMIQGHNYVFIEFLKITELQMNKYFNISGSYAVIKCKGKFLVCYNNWRNQWELPAGKREMNESPKQCAIRELYEETGQIVNDLAFKGLLMSKNIATGTIKYNPVYATEIQVLQPFIENNEISKIKLWDLKKDIGCFDELDREIFKYII
ncbi:NUDIX domain-containing protein [Solibacillus silvestris]|uniref:NUDIX domain-containing protein n=1 Tax=Solibacillus silvestris TaxID=76853 RepID=UPI003F7E1B11